MSYLARVTYTGNGSTTGYALPFSYIASSHVFAYLDNVNTTAFTIAGSTLTFTTAPSSGVVITLKRITPSNARLVDFTDGSVLTEADLDQSADQNFFLSQETKDDGLSTIQLTNADVFDALSKRIINVANPTGNNDAVNKTYLENTWLSTSDKSNITTLSAQASKIALLGTSDAIADMNVLATADVVSDLNTLANSDIVADLNTLASSDIVTDMNTLATSANVTAMGLLGNSTTVTNMGLLGTSAVTTNVATVAGKNTEIGLLGTSANVPNMATLGTSSNVSNMSTLAGITNLTNLANAHSAVSNVSTNIAGVNSFADRYRVQSGVPTSSLNVGDLNFDTNANELKVYKSSGWAAAGSTVNGTSARFTYTATANQTTFTGADLNGSTLAYDASFIDCYLNGVKLINGTDVTVTSGTSVVLATGATVGDTLDLVGFGTFNVASIAGTAITSGTINVARLPSTVLNSNIDLTNLSGTNITSGTVPNARLTGTGAITINGSAVALGGSVTVGETKPTITSLTPTTITNSATDVVIAGANYVSVPNVEIISSTGAITYPNTIAFNNSGQLTINVTLGTDGTYFIRVENPDGNAVRTSSASLVVSDAPVISTSGGSLGSFPLGDTISIQLSGTGDSALTWSATGTFPTGISMNSAGLISGTESSSITSATTYSNLAVTLTDNESQTTAQTFSITITVYTGSTGGGQFN